MTLPNSASSDPGNENWPVIRLNAVGNEQALARVLLRVLVRRALLSEGVLAKATDGNDSRRAG